MNKSRNPVILSAVHHRQNRLDSTRLTLYAFIAEARKQLFFSCDVLAVTVQAVAKAIRDEYH
jgi:hypothetical protein